MSRGLSWADWTFLLVGLIFAEGRDHQLFDGGIDREFQAADVAAIAGADAGTVLRLAMVNLRMTRRTLPRHGTRTLSYASAEGQLSRPVVG